MLMTNHTILLEILAHYLLIGTSILILNFAMGGDMGGDIDSGFTSESMEIDYVKVYQ
jgi:hypothetical protein